MDDKSIMENLLITEKGVCDLYLHGTVESANAKVTQAFNKALNESLTMQGSIYKEMSQKGWYPASQAPDQQVKQVKQKYSSCC